MPIFTNPSTVTVTGGSFTDIAGNVNVHVVAQQALGRSHFAGLSFMGFSYTDLLQFMQLISRI
jgi:hypothetical protein